jgi:catechol 2,3-dioxygenase-like lactoylglutathione lyase family enzyme
VRIDRLDHLVLTVTDLDATIEFYAGVLGMTHTVFADGRHALTYGANKINLHQAGHEFEPKAVSTGSSAASSIPTQTAAAPGGKTPIEAPNRAARSADEIADTQLASHGRDLAHVE